MYTCLRAFAQCCWSAGASSFSLLCSGLCCVLSPEASAAIPQEWLQHVSGLWQEVPQGVCPYPFFLRVLPHMAFHLEILRDVVPRHSVVIELCKLQAAVATVYWRAARVEDVHAIKRKLLLLFQHVCELSHYSAPKGMPTPIRTELWILAAKVTIFLPGPLGTAQPAPKENQEVVAQVAACQTVSTPD